MAKDPRSRDSRGTAGPLPPLMSKDVRLAIAGIDTVVRSVDALRAACATIDMVGPDRDTATPAELATFAQQLRRIYGGVLHIYGSAAADLQARLGPSATDTVQ